MFRVETGRTSRYCDGISRRSFVQLGIAGLATAPLARVLQARETASTADKKDTSVILVWLDGGPSHMDLYDLKPQAPAEYRGIWRPIPTVVPGFDISELFPRQAKIADKFSLVRSLYHNTGDHFTGGHIILTSRGGVSGANTASRYPSIGSIATAVCGPRQSGMPAHAAVPYASSIGLRPGYFGANYLGVQHNPFEIGGDPNSDDFKVKNVQLGANLTLDRLESRQTLLSDVDRFRREVDATGAAESMNRFQQQAYDLVTGPRAQAAFDLSQEDVAVRESYGRHTWGQSTLLARRLVEAGSTFVTVHFGGWDHHWDLKTGMENYLPRVDAAVSGLITDLDRRNLLDQVLVVVCGEFSRTPRMNDGGNGGPPLSKGTPGRDHWGGAMFCLLAGGGIRGGQIVGATDRLGERPVTRLTTAGDLHATIYKVLGVDPATKFLDHAGRPTPAIDDGEVIHELI